VIPIRELLNRIRWDAEFGRADFGIGYYDRIQDKIVVVTIRQVFFSPGNHFSIEVIDDAGESRAVPLHRIREVYRNSVLVWERHPE
jgi:uncharacterized protein (UPF0248 family)